MNRQPISINSNKPNMNMKSDATIKSLNLKAQASLDQYAKENPEVGFMIAYVKFLLKMGAELGISMIDWAGYLLGLNVKHNWSFFSTPISKQTIPELAQNLTKVGEKLKDPVIRAKIYELIQELEPIAQQAALSFVNVAMNSAKLAVTDAMALACQVPPFSVLCGITKMVSAGEEFVAKSMESGAEAIEAGKQAQYVVEEANIDLQRAQHGGMIGGLKKHKKDKKLIFTRLNKSINNFLKTKTKTKRRRI